MAEKKISELPIIETPSGSAIIPIVVDSTNSYSTANTNAISASALAFYVGQQLNAARTNTTNTFANTQNFNGAVFLNGDINVVGNLIGGVRNEINGLEAYTSSLKGQAIVSSSQQITNLGFISSSQTINTGSLVTTSSFNLYTASQSTASLVDRLNSIESVTGSFTINTQLLQLYQVTASLNQQTGSQDSVNLGISVFTGSLRSEVNLIEAYTASLKGAIEVSGQDVNVLGMITAQQFNVTYVSSSTMYQSGSTKFGDTSDDRHEFTGSILVGGDVLGNSGLNQFTSSQNLVNLGIAIVTGSLNSQTGSQDLVNLGISTFTGSIREEINSIQAYTSSLKGQAIVSSSTQISNYHKFAETASANTFYGTQTFSGSFNVSGSTTFNGVHTLSGSNTIVGNTLMTGTNTIIGNTEMSGSIEVSGSSNFHNSVFIVTGSSYFTGSHEVKGNSTFSGSINIASGSSYYRAGNKLFNYGQWGSLETQSGSVNTAYPMKLDIQYNGAEGVYVANDGSGFPTRLTVENTGLYNIQFSAQLHTTATEACDFSVWFAMTGSNMADSNTDFSVEKISGGGFGVAALNLLTPITAGDYIELYWSNDTGNGQLQYKAAQSTPTRPATPSIIVTVTQIA